MAALALLKIVTVVLSAFTALGLACAVWIGRQRPDVAAPAGRLDHSHSVGALRRTARPSVLGARPAADRAIPTCAIGGVFVPRVIAGGRQHG